MQNKAKWKSFEEYVAEIQKHLSPNAVVEKNKSIIGKSGVERQLDITVTGKIGQFEYFIVIDCKDWKNKVDINDVGSFADLVEDVSANKGALVCSGGGFTAGALKRAKEKGINLYNAIDVESLDWKVHVEIPILCKTTSIYKLGFTFLDFDTLPAEILNSLDTIKLLEIFDKEKKYLGLFGNILNKKWNESKLNVVVGLNENVSFLPGGVFIKYNDEFFYSVIKINIEVKENTYLGYVPLKKGKGFADAESGKFHIREMETVLIDTYEIKKNWDKIENPDELAIKPSITFYSVHNYPLINDKKS